MTNEFLHAQFERLRARFGKKAFDTQISHLIASEVWSMSESDFIGLVNFLIGTKPATRPPLLEDFRNGRLAAEKRRLDRDAKAASGVMASDWTSGGLRRALDANADWRGCKTLMEAVEVERLKLLVHGANNDDGPKGAA